MQQNSIREMLIENGFAYSMMPRNALGLAIIIKRELNSSKISDFNKTIENIKSKELFKKIVDFYHLKEKETVQLINNFLNFTEAEMISEFFYFDEIGKSYTNRSTPNELIKFMIRLLGIKRNSKIIDAFSGEGNIGFEILKNYEDVSVDEYEINEENMLLAEIKAYALKLDMNFYSFDIYKNNIEKRYDYAIADIPFINKYNNDVHKSLCEIYKSLNLECIPARVSGSYVCALKLLDCINENGKVVTTFFPGGLFNTMDKEIRKYMIDNNYVEEIINLPENLLSGTGIAISLMVLSKNKENNKIKMLDLSDCVIKKRPVSEFDLEKAIIKYENEAREITIDEIIKNDYSLNINVYTKKVEIENAKMLSKIVIDMFRGYQITSNQIKNLAVRNEKDANYKVLEISNIDDDGIIEDSKMFINSKEKNLDRYLLKKGDILLSARGEKTKIAIFDKDDEKYIANGSINVIRVDEKIINPIYLKMFFESQKGKISLNNIKSGITIPSLNIGDLQKMNVSCPSIKKQRELVDKYELKSEIIQSTKNRLLELSRELKDLVDLI